jgi:hypothetical protein
LRRALQRLLSRLLAVWRHRHADDRSTLSAIVDDPSLADRDRV